MGEHRLADAIEREWQPGYRGPAHHIHAPVDALAGSDADRRFAAEQGSAALLCAIKAYAAKYHPGVRL